MRDQPATLGAAATNSDLDLFCPQCSYDLRGIASERCPECGIAVDRAATVVSRIPWVHRRMIGRVRAYWQTNLIVIRRSGQIVEEMNRPVSFEDAQRFRHVTVLLAWLPIAACILVPYLIDAGLPGFIGHVGNRLGWVLQGAVVIVGIVAAWLFLMGVTGIASYFFHPSRMPVVRQNRAVALSYYTCAPLGWLFVPALLFAIFALLVTPPVLERGLDQRISMTILMTAISALAAIVLLWWFRVVRVMRGTTHCGAGRVIALTIYLPVACAILGALAAGLVLASTFISLLILSCR